MSFVQQAMGTSLAALRQLAGSDLLDRWRLRKPAEKLLYRGTHTGFTLAQRAIRFDKRPAPKRATRLPRPGSTAPFDLTPSEEQEMMRQSARRFASDVLRPAAAEADARLSPPEEILVGAQDLGLALLAVPEQYGGAAESRSWVTGALVAEELARGDAGLAYAILAPLGVVNALVDYGTAEQQARFLPPFVEAGHVAAAMAVLEPKPLFDPFALSTRAVRTPGGFKLFGEKSLVAQAGSAELFLVAADLMGAGPRLFAVERGTPQLEVSPEPAMGLRAAATGRLKLSGVKLAESALIGGDAAFDYQAVVDAGRIAWSAMAVGTAQAVLDYVVPYCNDRVAFGEPITNRQSVAFMIADVAIELEAMRLLVWRAASRGDRGLPVTREAALAKLQAARYARQIGSAGVQLLGGHGYVKDHPVERWYRQLTSTAIVEGGLSV